MEAPPGGDATAIENFRQASGIESFPLHEQEDLAVVFGEASQCFVDGDFRRTRLVLG